MPNLEETILSILDGKQHVVLMADYIIPLHVGTSGYTEYVIDPVKLFQVYDAFPELEGAYIGHVHSHNNMAVYFSGTDKEQLEDGANGNALFVSMIVNNRSEVTAMVSLGVESSYTFAGRMIQGSEKKIMAYKAKLAFGGQSTDEVFADLCDSIPRSGASFPPVKKHETSYFQDGKDVAYKKDSGKVKKKGKEEGPTSADDKPMMKMDVAQSYVNRSDIDGFIGAVGVDNPKEFWGALNESHDFDSFSAEMATTPSFYSITGLDPVGFELCMYNMYLDMFSRCMIVAYYVTYFNAKDPIKDFASMMRDTDMMLDFNRPIIRLFKESNLSPDMEKDKIKMIINVYDKMLKIAFGSIIDVMDLTKKEESDILVALINIRYIIIRNFIMRSIFSDQIASVVMEEVGDQRDNLIKSINGSHKSKNESSSMVVN